MKVFGCRNKQSFGGGLVLVASNTKEEAYLHLATSPVFDYLFDWHDNNGWIEPDGDINHCVSDTYPFEAWFEITDLSADFTETTIIVEDHYTERTMRTMTKVYNSIHTCRHCAHCDWGKQYCRAKDSDMGVVYMRAKKQCNKYKLKAE